MAEAMTRPTEVNSSWGERTGKYLHGKMPRRSAGFLIRNIRVLAAAEALVLLGGGGLAWKAGHDSKDTRDKITTVLQANRYTAGAGWELTPGSSGSETVLDASYPGETVRSNPQKAGRSIEIARGLLKASGIHAADAELELIQGNIADDARLQTHPEFDVVKTDLREKVGKGIFEPLEAQLEKQKKKQELNKVRGERAWQGALTAPFLLMALESAGSVAWDGLKRGGRRVRRLFTDSFDVDNLPQNRDPQKPAVHIVADRVPAEEVTIL